MQDACFDAEFACRRYAKRFCVPVRLGKSDHAEIGQTVRVGADFVNGSAAPFLERFDGKVGCYAKPGKKRYDLLAGDRVYDRFRDGLVFRKGNALDSGKRFRVLDLLSPDGKFVADTDAEHRPATMYGRADA